MLVAGSSQLVHLLASYDPVDRCKLKVFPALLGLSSSLLPDARLEAPTRLTAMSGKPAGDVRWVMLMGPFQWRTASSVSERSGLRRGVARQVIRSAGERRHNPGRTDALGRSHAAGGRVAPAVLTARIGCLDTLRSAAPH